MTHPMAPHKEYNLIQCQSKENNDDAFKVEWNINTVTVTRDAPVKHVQMFSSEG